MVPFIFLFIGVLLLVPIIAFLPLPISFRGRWYIVGISLLFAAIGTIGLHVLQLWQMSLYLILLCMIVAYFVEKKFSLFFLLTQDATTSSKVEEDRLLTQEEPDRAIEDAVEMMENEELPVEKDLPETEIVKDTYEENVVIELKEDDVQVIDAPLADIEDDVDELEMLFGNGQIAISESEDEIEEASQDWLEHLLNTTDSTEDILPNETVEETSEVVLEEEPLEELLEFSDLEEELAISLQEDDANLEEEQQTQPELQSDPEPENEGQSSQVIKLENESKEEELLLAEEEEEETLEIVEIDDASLEVREDSPTMEEEEELVDEENVDPALSVMPNVTEMSTTTRELLHSISDQLHVLQATGQSQDFEELVETMLRQDLPDEMYFTFMYEKVNYLLQNKRFEEVTDLFDAVSLRYQEYPLLYTQLAQMNEIALEQLKQ